MCLTALFFKNDKMIDANYKMSVNNVPGSEVIYLDQANWAIASQEPDQMKFHVIHIDMSFL